METHADMHNSDESVTTMDTACKQERTPIEKVLLNLNVETYVEKQDEARVYFFIKNGGTLGIGKFIIQWPTLKSSNQQSLLDLLSLFNYSGINDYHEHPTECITYHCAQSNFSTPFEFAVTTDHLYYQLSLLGNTYRSIKNYFSPPSTSIDLTYATPVNKRNSLNQTMLIWASLLERTEDVTTLLSKGAQINARDGRRRTALHYAARYASPKMVKLLIDAGALLNVRDMAGKFPLEHAGEMNRIGTLLVLITALKTQDHQEELKKGMTQQPDWMHNQTSLYDVAIAIDT
jgi:hypothetical protein